MFKMFKLSRFGKKITTDSGIGQLMLYSVVLPGRQKLVLVLPEQVNRTLEERLNKLGVDVLPYKWRGDEVVFSGPIVPGA